MKWNEYKELAFEGNTIEEGSEADELMRSVSQEALKITADLNNSYHTPEEIREIMCRLTEKNVDEEFSLFPPFYTECGRNITFGKHMKINSGCKFIDWGGIFFGDDVLIGPNVVFSTVNHSMNPDRRKDSILKAIYVGNKVWIGAGAIILPGVSIGDGAVVAAGAVVKNNVPEKTIVAGVPAKVIGNAEDEADIEARKRAEENKKNQIKELEDKIRFCTLFIKHAKLVKGNMKQSGLAYELRSNLQAELMRLKNSL